MLAARRKQQKKKTFKAQKKIIKKHGKFKSTRKFVSVSHQPTA